MENKLFLKNIQILILYLLFLLKRVLMMIYQKLKDLLEIPNPCHLQKIGIQNLLLLICSLKKDLFKHSFLFLLISFMNGILMVCLNRKSLIKWVICLWLVLLTKIIMILTNLKLLIYLLLVFLVLFVDGEIHISQKNPKILLNMLVKRIMKVCLFFMNVLVEVFLMVSIP